MGASYAYLIVAQKRYAIDPPGDTTPLEAGEEVPSTDATDPFPTRLRRALDTAARGAGYGSLQRLMGSVRVRELSTPHRAEQVQGLLGAGLLEGDAEVSQMANGAVPDPIWTVLREIQAGRGQDQPIPGPPRKATLSKKKTRFIDSWSLAMHSSAGVTPVEIEPAEAPGHTLPVALIARALEALSSEGWTVIQVSEDRSIDDAATTSWVVRQRFLLRR
jgi:hypothetical protein